MEDDIFGASRAAREQWDTSEPLEEESCRACQMPGFKPGHMPSPRCERNGTIAHCDCPRCFG